LILSLMPNHLIHLCLDARTARAQNHQREHCLALDHSEQLALACVGVDIQARLPDQLRV
jgi:hypothetical protein